MPGKAYRFPGGSAVLCCWLLCVGLFGQFSKSFGQNARDYSVEVTARTQSSPAQIHLEWPSHSLTSEIKVFRKAPHQTTWQQVGHYTWNQNSFTDGNINAETLYEYRIERKFSTGPTAYGYITAGINIPLVENRGKVLLLLDDAISDPLAEEITRLEQDLVGDFWQVLRLSISQSNTPPQIRERIRQVYNQHSNLKSLIILGNVPVPYSGGYAADGHANHTGAWPADGYYGEMTSEWTDSTVTATNGERKIWWNIPGDGKFDQILFPSPVELQVGRIDMSDLTCFANKTPSKSELDLLRQYLNKNHNWRHGRLDVRRKGLVFDWMGQSGPDPLAGSGYRNFSGFFGPDNVDVIGYGQYFSTTTANSYLWSICASGGSFYYSVGVGNSDEFALQDPKVVFTMFVGSYFGDWDNESNFMRAALGTQTYTLTSSYSGIPHTPYHHMALGQTVGYGILLSQNNKDAAVYPPSVTMEGKVHISLLGDPTLRMHPVAPPRGLIAVTNNGNMILTWQKSLDPNAAGYAIYGASSLAGPFTRISGSGTISTTNYVVTSPQHMVYMVKALKLESTSSGTYVNASQGIFWNRIPTNNLTVPSAPKDLLAKADSSTTALLSWIDTSGTEMSFSLQRAFGTEGAFTEIARLNPNTTSYTDIGLQPGAAYRYRIAAMNSAGLSVFSEEAVVVLFNHGTISTKATFIGEDRTSKGNWVGKYGSDGYNLVAGPIKYPDYLETIAAPPTAVLNSPGHPYALENPAGTSRVSGFWHAWGSKFSFDIRFKDTRSHRVAFYLADWHGPTNRSEKIEIENAATGQLLYETNIVNFNGVYLVLDIAGNVKVKVSVTNGYPMLSGLFFDTPPTPVEAPVVSPVSGASSTPFSASLNSMTPGAQIRYTLDGSQPTTNSPLYSQPLWIDQTVTLKAQGYKEGLASSATITAEYKLLTAMVSPVQVLVMREDAHTAGDWVGRFGSKGFHIPRANSPLLQISSSSGSQTWVWNDPTEDTRALFRASAGPQRIASAYYSPTGFSFNLNFQQPAELTLYFLDWDRMGRKQRVEFRDTAGQLLAERVLNDFTNGVYITFRVHGEIKMTVSSLNDRNAVLMGMFLDATSEFVPPPPLDPPKLSTCRLKNGRFEITVQGNAGQSAVLEHSEDLATWLPLSTNILQAAEIVVDAGATSGLRPKFFRLKP